jgi:hypothetical protein
VQSATVSNSQTAASSPVKPLTRAQARLLVQAVNLRANDLPGSKVSSEKKKSARVKVPFDIDIAGFVVGQVEVTLFAAGLPEPVPTATERRLLALLVSRAEARAAGIGWQE